jgi:type II secretory ATPase GspE/PulE/Tfp pilus assembly ATPase PilB-like protein
VLQPLAEIPHAAYVDFVRRVKFESKLKLNIVTAPQDGQYTFSYGEKSSPRTVNVRVATLPSRFGEKLTLRLLDPARGIIPLEKLGFPQEIDSALQNLMELPNGLILVTGPTGSGKTTTLYALLSTVIGKDRNIITLEDPIEYEIPGIVQSEVDPEHDYTFATGLRTTLRQDPDIIMVGEIRDGETAKLAIQAALTGHLVFSTIHTNTACGIVPRLIDMGVDPYLISPTLCLGVAQRLVRKNCEGAGEEVKVEGIIKSQIDEDFADLPEEFRKELPAMDSVLRLKPTADCPMGTRGREAVFEMYEMDRDLEAVILSNPTENALYDVVRKKGMLTMREHAIVKALEHGVPWEEVAKL